MRIQWTQTEVTRTKFRIKPTTGGYIIHSSRVLEPKQEEEHENQKQPEAKARTAVFSCPARSSIKKLLQSPHQ